MQSFFGVPSWTKKGCAEEGLIIPSKKKKVNARRYL